MLVHCNQCCFFPCNIPPGPRIYGFCLPEEQEMTVTMSHQHPEDFSVRSLIFSQSYFLLVLRCLGVFLKFVTTDWLCLAAHSWVQGWSHSLHRLNHARGSFRQQLWKKVSELSHRGTGRAHAQIGEATGPKGGAETSSAQPSWSQGKPLSAGKNLFSVVRDSLNWWVSWHWWIGPFPSLPGVAAVTPGQCGTVHWLAMCVCIPTHIHLRHTDKPPRSIQNIVFQTTT